MHDRFNKMTDNKRIVAIDAGRGAAMLFVFLSHFAEVYFQNNHQQAILEKCWHIGMVASPTFMLISGIVLGYLYCINKNNFKRIKLKLIDRGLFLLTIGHVFILFAHIPMTHGIRNALHWTFITDAIAISIITGPLIISYLSKAKRLLLGLSIYIVCLLVIYFWRPASIMILNILEEELIGTLHKFFFVDNFSILIWFSVYLCGSALGEIIGELHLEQRDYKIKIFLSQLGILLITSAIGIKFIYHFLLSPGFKENFFFLSNFFQKNPPGPTYLFFYGGIGLLILTLLFWLEEKKWFGHLLNILSNIGKASLIIFIIQYYVYFSLFEIFHLAFTKLWLIYFILSVVLIILCGNYWLKKNYNKYFTIINLGKELKELIKNTFKIWKRISTA